MSMESYYQRWMRGLDDDLLLARTSFIASKSSVEIPRYGSKEFGSVFKRGHEGGPYNIHRDQLPSWRDWRNEGNTDSKEKFREITRKWNSDQVKRFKIFLEAYCQEDKTIWRKEWFDKTTGKLFEKQERKILDCKFELIKRLLHILVAGPESLEDWALLYLYHDSHLDIPKDIESLVRPITAGVTLDELFDPKELVAKPHPKNVVIPPFNSMRFPANQGLRGIKHDAEDDGNETKPKFFVLGQGNRNLRHNFNSDTFGEFPFGPTGNTLNALIDDGYDPRNPALGPVSDDDRNIGYSKLNLTYGAGNRPYGNP